MSREPSTIDESRARSRPALGIGRRLGAVFALLAALLATIGVVVSLRVGEMHQSIAQVFEEQRESMYSRDIAHAMHAVETHVKVHDWATHGVEATERTLLRELTTDAIGALAELEKGPGNARPSATEHSNEESRLSPALEQALSDPRRGRGIEARSLRAAVARGDAERAPDEA